MLLTAWASQNMEAEPELRTVLFASGTVLSYIQSAFVPLGVYPASQAPNWKIGAKLYLGFALVALVMYVGIYFGFRKDEKRKEKDEGEQSSIE